jgi:hypothetical protein
MADVGLIARAAALVPGFLRAVFPNMPRNERERVRKSIRQIYFTSDGTMLILEAIATGNQIPRDASNRVRHFVEADAEVGRALSEIEVLTTAETMWAHRDFLELLQLARYGKFSARQEVMNMITESGPNGKFSEYNVHRAKELLESVRELNAALDHIDRELGLRR